MALARCPDCSYASTNKNTEGVYVASMASAFSRNDLPLEADTGSLTSTDAYNYWPSMQCYQSRSSNLVKLFSPSRPAECVPSGARQRRRCWLLRGSFEAPDSSKLCHDTARTCAVTTAILPDSALSPPGTSSAPARRCLWGSMVRYPMTDRNKPWLLWQFIIYYLRFYHFFVYGN